MSAAYLYVEITDPAEIDRLNRIGAKPIADAMRHEEAENSHTPRALDVAGGNQLWYIDIKFPRNH